MSFFLEGGIGKNVRNCHGQGFYSFWVGAAFKGSKDQLLEKQYKKDKILPEVRNTSGVTAKYESGLSPNLLQES